MTVLELNGSDFFLLFSVSFALTSVLTPLMRFIAIRFRILDAPTQAHKTHVIPIPYLGGVSIVISTIFVTYGASLVSDFTRNTFQLASTIIVPATLMALIGLIDDIRHLQPWPRFIAQNLIAFISAFILVRTDTLGSPTGRFAADLFITVLWLVGVTNAINFFDNVDGGASGTVAISSLALSVLAINNNQFLIAGMSIVLAGSTLGFLIWNKPPARIYMGDAGALFLGLLLASLAVRLNTSANPTYLGLVIPFLLLAVPILDTSVAVTKRVVRGLSPFQGGRDHLSHRLMRHGLAKRPAVFLLWTLSLIFSFIALGIELLKDGRDGLLMSIGILFWITNFIFFIRTRDQD